MSGQCKKIKKHGFEVIGFERSKNLGEHARDNTGCKVINRTGNSYAQLMIFTKIPIRKRGACEGPLKTLARAGHTKI